MRGTLICTLFLLGAVQSAAAEDGFYYGVGLGLLKSEASAPIVAGFDATATDASLALTAGYRWPQTKNVAFGVEGNLDVHTGHLMSDVADACTSVSPSWCEVNSTLRLRGTLGSVLANGDRLTASLGAVAVRGRLEANPGDYRRSTGSGWSVGVFWEKASSTIPVRIDLNFDKIENDNIPTYGWSLEMFGVRVSYMF